MSLHQQAEQEHYSRESIKLRISGHKTKSVKFLPQSRYFLIGRQQRASERARGFKGEQFANAFGLTHVRWRSLGSN